MSDNEKEIRELALKVMTREYVETWLDTPLSTLGGLKPKDAIKRGQFIQVKHLLNAVRTGGYR